MNAFFSHPNYAVVENQAYAIRPNEVATMIEKLTAAGYEAKQVEAKDILRQSHTVVLTTAPADVVSACHPRQSQIWLGTMYTPAGGSRENAISLLPYWSMVDEVAMTAEEYRSGFSL